MQIVIAPAGDARCLYGEEIDLHVLGRLAIRRASHVDPTENGEWVAAIEDGPVLGPFPLRSQALDAERQWLERQWLK